MSSGSVVTAEHKASSKSDLEAKLGESKKSKISLVEGTIVVLISLAVEILEWIGDLANVIPVAGQVIWFIIFIFGLVVSVGIFIWSYLRGMYVSKGRVLKLALMIGGGVADLLTGGLFPETATLIAAILYHNYLEGKKGKGLVNLLKK